VYQLLARGL